MAVTTRPPPRSAPRRRPRPPARPPQPRDGRRRWPVGHALAVMLIALLGACLLNAKGMRKTAHGQPEGASRDVAVALTGGLSAVTGFFQIDEPRKLLQAALGRSGDDRVSDTIRFAARPRARRPVHQPKPVYSPRKPLKILVTGDSLLSDPGKALLEKLPGHPALKSDGGVDTHVATGLARPDVFNWFEYLPGQVKRLHPGVTVLSFGGNDGQPLQGTGGGQQDVTSPAWQREYARRVGGMMDELNAEGTRIVWVGLPIPRDGHVATGFRVMNKVFAQEAARRPGEVLFVNEWGRFADKRGRYADYLPDEHGHLTKMRLPDGIHYQFAAAQIVADDVLAALPRLVTLKP